MNTTDKTTTQEKIADAFIRLLEKYSYEKVSVAEITNAVPVSRNTFYYYFEGKDDLTRWIVVQHYLKYCFPFFKFQAGIPTGYSAVGRGGKQAQRLA